MKKTIKLLIALVFVFCICTVTLVACLVDPPIPVPPSRGERVDNFVSAVLSATNSAWNRDMTDEAVVALEAPGSYIAANHWVQFVGEVLEDSTLQDGKIQVIADYFSSEDGKAFLSLEKVDVNKVFACLSAIGLTSRDVESLVYTALYSFIKDGAEIFDQAIEHIDNITRNTTLNSEKREDLSANREIMVFGRDSWAVSSSEAQNALSALESTESAIKSVVSFTYQNAMMFGNGVDSGLFSALQSGALTGASSTEIATYLTSVFDAVEDFEASLSGISMAEFSASVRQILDFVDMVTVSNSTMDTIGLILENGAMISTALPLAVKLLDNLEDVALGGDNHQFINGVMTSLGSEYVEKETNANSLIAYARLILGLLGVDYTSSKDVIDLAKADFKALLDGVADDIEASSISYEEKLPMLYVAFVLNAESEEEFVGDVTVKRISDVVVASIYLNQFKKHFREYQAGVNDSVNNLVSTATMLLRYCTGQQGVNVGTNYTSQWFNDICTQAQAKLEAEADACYPSAFADVKGKIDVLAGECIDKLVSIASFEPVKISDAEKFNAQKETIEALYDEIINAILR